MDFETIKVAEASTLLAEDASDSDWLVEEVTEKGCTNVEPAEEGVSTMYVPDTLPEGNTVVTVMGPEIKLRPV